MSQHNSHHHKDINLTIDGIAVTVPRGTRILEAAKKAGVKIPTLCEHPDLCKRAVCRICVVECDGRGKLAAACANDVWEGVNIVTNNARIFGIRKMILELILANHPMECLTCIRNTHCELQSLAADLDIRKAVFRHDAADHSPPVTESDILVRDMSKCIKCGRCVEACQELQTIRSINSSHRSIHYEISTPYGQSLADGPCVFCGKCAEVCPVGAIYEYDKSAQAWAALGDSDRRVAAQVSPSLGAAFDKELGLPAGTVSPGKMVTALKRLGFDAVYDAEFFAGIATAEKNRELASRIANNGKTASAKLPMISGCTQGWIKFAESSYPDLKEHFFTGRDHLSIFNSLIKTHNAKTSGISIVGCVAKKFRLHNSETNAADTSDLVLTVKEIARMFTLAGIDFNGLPETDFTIFEGENPANSEEITAKTLTVYGFAKARAVLDSIRKGECDARLHQAMLVEIKSCPT